MAGAAVSQGQLFSRIELRDRRNTFESSGADFVAGATLSQGQIHILRQVRHFRKVKHRFRGRRSTFTRSCTYFVAGAALSQGQAQISWQAHHFRKVKCIIRGRCSTFARSSTDFVAGAALSQGQVHSLAQPGMHPAGPPLPYQPSSCLVCVPQNPGPKHVAQAV